MVGNGVFMSEFGPGDPIRLAKRLLRLAKARKSASVLGNFLLMPVFVERASIAATRTTRDLIFCSF